MTDPSRLKFTDSHEWVGDGGEIIRVGISDFWQQRLSDITHVELPEPDDHHYEAREDMGVVESLEMAADFHAPVPGVIVAINTELLSTPELINTDPYGDGWLVEMRPDSMSDLDDLLEHDEYEAGLPDEYEPEEE
jgi:glycine cleavage system H protein